MSSPKTFNIYKVWFTQPGDLPDHVALAFVDAANEGQDEGICCHAVGSHQEGWSYKVMTYRFEDSQRYSRKENQNLQMPAGLLERAKQLCREVELPRLGDDRDCRHWADDLLWKVQLLVGRYEMGLETLEQ